MGKQTITLGGGGSRAFTYTYPNTFSEVYYGNVNAAESLTTSNGTAKMCGIRHMTISEIEWYIKNNATASGDGSRAYAVRQYCLIIGKGI